jgi:hypothetical protein
VQAPFASQSLNRYSYAWNDPLSLTDLSGFCTGTHLCNSAGLLQPATSASLTGLAMA